MKPLTTRRSSLQLRNFQLRALERQNADLNNGNDNEFVDPPMIKETVSFPSDGNLKNIGGDSDSSDDDDNFAGFETCLVMEFSRDINDKALHWIIDKLRSKKFGGAGLMLRKEPSTNPNQGLVIHISAENTKFLQIADELGIMKPTISGVMKSFNISCLDDFFLNNTMDIDDILTLADKQIIIKHSIDSVRAKEYERHLPGYEIIQFYHGQSIVAACLEEELIINIYSLRDTEFLKKFGPAWYFKWFKKQPLEQIREYFGESIGIYFAFVEYYTLALILPAMFGIVQYFTPGSFVPYFCVFYVIWLTVFLEIWKRKCSVLAYRWGTISMTNLDIPRTGYYGKIRKDPITAKLQPQYPIWKTYALMYCVSLPIILICMLPAALLAISQFYLEDKVLTAVGPDSYLAYVPSIIEALIVAVFSGKYEILANKLTDWENHRTQAQYERHRVVKLIALEFVNNFLSLFYIAFWIGDVKLLSSQLMTQLIVFQIVQKLQGTLWPLIMPKLIALKDSYFNGSNGRTANKDDYEHLNIEELSNNDERIVQSKYEGTLLEYNSTYEDYLEMYIQFGYVVLFASVSPLAAAFALVNNFIEIRIDAYKLCCVFKRPFAKRAKNTGAWLLAFETLLVMSIITNCGLLYMQPEIKRLQSNLTSQEFLMVFVIVEHLLLAIAWAINRAISDRPWWVRVALAKADYESRQAMKRESSQTTRKVLFRRFYSVHGRQRGK